MRAVSPSGTETSFGSCVILIGGVLSAHTYVVTLPGAGITAMLPSPEITVFVLSPSTIQSWSFVRSISSSISVTAETVRRSSASQPENIPYAHVPQISMPDISSSFRLSQSENMKSRFAGTSPNEGRRTVSRLVQPENISSTFPTDCAFIPDISIDVRE